MYNPYFYSIDRVQRQPNADKAGSAYYEIIGLGITAHFSQINNIFDVLIPCAILMNEYY